MSGRSRANGEGSIFPYRNGFAAYTWIRQPDGQRRKKWVYGKTRAEVHDKWIKLQSQAQNGVVAATSLTLAEYMTYWLAEVVQPNRGQRS
jgi:hypothetical protein